MEGIMRTLSSDRGITLFELLLAITIVSLLITSLLPTVIQFRKREINWREEVIMEQEAIRFFSYFENRNACVVNWSTSGTSVVIEVCEQRNGRTIRRQFYKDSMDRAVEVDAITGGYIIIAHLVKKVQFSVVDHYLNIELTLSNGGQTRIYKGVLTRSIDK